MIVPPVEVLGRKICKGPKEENHGKDDAHGVAVPIPFREALRHMQLLHIYHKVNGSDEVEVVDIQQLRQPLPSDGTQPQPHEDAVHEAHAGEEGEDVDSD